VNVVDTTSPDISPSPTIYFVVSPLNNWISWNITDLNPANFTVYKDGAFFASGDWNNSDNVMINVDGLTEGAYNFEIYAQDSQGNNNSNIIIVVVDETAPYFLVERPACETPEGENCEGITWWRTNSELYKNHYIIYVNGTPDSPVTWDNELISYDVSNMLRGYYNITIAIFDETGNFNSTTAWVTIYDGSPPSFSDPPPTKIPVIEGTFGNVITWENDDEYPEMYEIFRNSQLVFTNTWIANNTNIYNIDGLVKGTYNFTIVAYDEALNPISFTVIVTVRDATLPDVISEPNIFEIHENNTDFSMEWVLTDTHPANYSVILDGEEIFQGIWVSSNPIIVNVGSLGLTPGEYNFTLIVRDQSLNVIVQSISITVKDVLLPNFISSIPEYEFYINETNQQISWQVYDLHPASYSIIIDNKLVVSNVWDSNNPIILNLDDLEIGTYNITIIVSDNSDNKISHFVIVKAKDPEIKETKIPSITLVEIIREGDIEYTNGTWVTRFDELVINNASIQVKLFHEGKFDLVEGSQYTVYTDDNGHFDLQFNYTQIPVGNYIWEISFTKDEFEKRTVEIPVSIIPHNYIVEIQIPAALERGEDYFITALVYYANNDSTSNLLSLNQLTTKTGRATGVEVQFDIVVSYEDGTSEKRTRNAFTTNKGFAVIQFAGAETQRMVGIDSISATAVSSDFGNPYTAILPESDLPDVENPPATGLEIITEFIVKYLTIIILLILTLSLILIIAFYTRKKMRTKIKAYLKTMDSAKIELDAILSIRAIIIQSSSGLPLYEKKVRTMEVDTTLISGLITAFSAFLGEVGREELFGFETIERQGLSITSHKFLMIRRPPRSTQELPLVLLDKISTSHLEIDNNYRRELTSDSGEVLNEHFLDESFEHAGLSIGVFEKLELNTRNIRKIRKVKSITRNVKDNINSLKKLYDQMGEEPVYIQSILEFFTKRGMSEEVSARAFLLAYRYKIINPIFD
jgi:hypothetical protein